MSYPSITDHLENQGVDLREASDEELVPVFMAAFQEDLPCGLAKVTELVEKYQQTKPSRVMLSLDPNSQEGKEFMRLLAPDMSRRVLERHYGVHFGFYNCCRGVAAATRAELDLSLREQIMVQDPEFVDC